MAIIVFIKNHSSKLNPKWALIGALYCCRYIPHQIILVIKRVPNHRGFGNLKNLQNLCKLKLTQIPPLTLIYLETRRMHITAGWKHTKRNSFNTCYIISHSLYIFYPIFSAIYNQDWLILQTIHVLNKDMWA